MSEKLTPSSSETAPKEPSSYDGLSRDTLDAVVAARESISADSDTPSADLRQAVRQALEDSGDERAFRRVYDMNNLELKSFVDGASGELKGRRVDELQAIIEAYDGNESFGDRRTALREALEAAGDERAFRRVYDMNNLELTSFVNDARQELQAETSLDKEDALEEAYAEYEEREGTPYDADKDRLKEEEDRLLDRVEELIKKIRSDPEAAEEADLNAEARKLLAELDEAKSKRKAEEIKTPKDDDLKDEEKLRTPKDDDLEDGDEKLREPKDDDLTDEEKLKEPKDDDLKDEEKLRTPKDDDLEEGDEKLREPKDDDLEEDEPVKQGLLKRAWNRIAAFGYKTGGASPAGVVRYGLERFRDSENKGKIVAFVGAAAIIGVAILGREQGWFDGGGQGGNVKPDDFTPGQKGGHPGGDGHIEMPSSAPSDTPEVLSGDGFAHPWNWMKEAMEKGDIKAPAGMGPEDALHYFGDKAAAAGHKVEWYNLPNGLEAIRVDGSDDTKVVADVLNQFAK